MQLELRLKDWVPAYDKHARALANHAHSAGPLQDLAPFITDSWIIYFGLTDLNLTTLIGLCFTEMT